MFSWLTTEHFQKWDINSKNYNLQLVVIHNSMPVQCFVKRTGILQKINWKKKE